MALFLFKLSTYVLIALCLTTRASAQCPAFCYCTESVADRICSLPDFSTKCEVQKCPSAECGGNGYRCLKKPANTPIPTPSNVISAPLTIISQTKKTEIQQKIADRGGCKVNVCFAIDGSGSINAESFEKEMGFVTDLIQIINPWNPSVGATQYNNRNHPISPLATDLTALVDAILKTQQTRGTTAIAQGINYCFGQIKPFPGEPNNVVVLGDGFNNAGADPIAAAQDVFNFGGLVAAVAAGQKINDAKLLELVGNNPGLKFKVDSFLDLAKLVFIMEQLALAICSGKF